MPPRIDAYRFGHVVIDGRAHTSDVIVRPDGVRAEWWRRQGHRLDPADLPDALEGTVEVLVVGTGASAGMAVPEATRRWLRERGVELRDLPTGEAVALYNRLTTGGRAVVAALHLTC